MVATVSKKITLAEFLAFQPEADIRYELENGELLEIPPERDLNQGIASFLIIYFAQLGVSSHCLRIRIEMAVAKLKESVRVPDLVVLSEADCPCVGRGNKVNNYARYATTGSCC